jgi:hypothetical protein
MVASGCCGEIAAVVTVDVRYARTVDNPHLAYTVSGSAPIDLVEVGNGTNISFDAADDQPRWDAYVERLGAFARVIRFDPRGIGLSDPFGSATPSCEGWADDTVAVMDAAGVACPALTATGHAGPEVVEPRERGGGSAGRAVRSHRPEVRLPPPGSPTGRCGSSVPQVSPDVVDTTGHASTQRTEGGEVSGGTGKSRGRSSAG